MALVTGSINNFFNGVSQQTPALRLPTQGEESINFYPSLISGLVKRPPTRHIQTVSTGTVGGSGAKIHIINRDVNTQHIAVFGLGEIKVFDLNGAQINVYYDTPTSYFSNTDPNSLKLLSVADHTFILNKKHQVKTTTFDPETKGNIMADFVVYGSVVYIKQANYDTTYTIEYNLNGTWLECASTTTPKNVGTVDKPPPKIGTDSIRDDLARGLAFFFSKNKLDHISVDFDKGKNLIFLQNGFNTKLKIPIRLTDSRGDTQMLLIQNEVQRFSDLPAKCIGGYMVKVTGEINNTTDEYYVQYRTDAGNDVGVWEERASPDHLEWLDGAYMPHALVWNGSSYTYKKLKWGGREAGDDITSPTPLFVGRTIEDMFVYRNRIGFLSDDSLSFSRAGDLFAFYQESATVITDADPISITSGHETVTNLKHAIPYQDTLMIFSDAVQFSLSTQDVLSPLTVALKVTTTYATNNAVKPVVTGNTIMFANTNGNYTGLMEYFIDNTSANKMAVSVTSHVPKYIPRNPRYLTCSTNEDVVIVGGYSSNKFYLYKYYWNGGEKLQSAWGEYTLGGQSYIVDAQFLESNLYMLVQRVRGLCIERIDFSDTVAHEDVRPTPHLDRLVSVSVQKLDEENCCVYTPYSITTGEEYVLINTKTMETFDTSYMASNQLKINKKYTDIVRDGGQLMLGVNYTAQYTFSQQFMRNRDGIASTTGRLQYLRWLLNYGYSGFFQVYVTHGQREAHAQYIYTFNGQTIGRNTNIIGKGMLNKGSFKFPVKSVSDRVEITLKNETHFPSSVLSAEWEANYTTRSGRI